jgi:hypothetical protein
VLVFTMPFWMIVFAHFIIASACAARSGSRSRSRSRASC